MVAPESGSGHSSAVPSIADLLGQHRDRTSDSYRDMSRRVRDEISSGRLHQLHTEVPKAFPEARTVVLLAELLQVPVTTVVLAVAASMGIPVQESESLLAISLPPGTDRLTDQDRDAVIAVTRALVSARQSAPILNRDATEAVRLAEDEDAGALTDSRQPDNGTTR